MNSAHRILTLVLLCLLLSATADAQDKGPLPIPQEYHELVDLTINMGAGSDVINIESTAQGTDTTINGNRGNDNFTVAGPPDPQQVQGEGQGEERREVKDCRRK